MRPHSPCSKGINLCLSSFHYIRGTDHIMVKMIHFFNLSFRESKLAARKIPHMAKYNRVLNFA